MDIKLEDLRVQDDVNLDGMEVKDDVTLDIGGVGISPERVPEKGDDGLSAYEIAVKNGFVGTEEEWLDSLKGEPGEPGEQGVPGENGEDGNGIVSIEKTATSGYVDTYTILFSNGTSTTFTVVNGVNGTNGENGKTPLFKSENNKLYVSYNDGGQWTYLQDIQEGTNGKDGKDGEDGKTPTFKVVNNILYVSYDNGLSWVGLGNIGGKDGKDGVDGEDGNPGKNGENGVGISNIQKTSTKGNVDTYTITLTNKQTYSFTVTNGSDGEDGEDGKDAVSPQIRINSTTNEWEVSTNKGVTWTSLGVKATGENGKDGIDGVNGKDGNPGKDGVNGEDGKSAYQIWLELGNVGTEQDFIDYLKADAANKVDKIVESSTKTYVYTTRNGVQGKYEINDTYDHSCVAVRNSTGQLNVPDTPTGANNATSKKYVDTSIETALSNLPTGGVKIYKHEFSMDDGASFKVYSLSNFPFYENSLMGTMEHKDKIIAMSGMAASGEELIISGANIFGMNIYAMYMGALSGTFPAKLDISPYSISFESYTITEV